jgi:hypothetical protein
MKFIGSLRTLCLAVLFCVMFPVQEAESLNEIVNMNPATILLYNLFRASDCFGLFPDFCDALVAPEDMGPPAEETVATTAAPTGGRHQRRLRA